MVARRNKQGVILFCFIIADVGLIGGPQGFKQPEECIALDGLLLSGVR